MKHLVLSAFLLLFGTLAGVFAQAEPAIVASATDSCESDGIIGRIPDRVFSFDHLNRVYFVNACRNRVRVTCYDTNLVRRWIVDTIDAANGFLGAEADPHGNLLIVTSRPGGDGMSVMKMDPDGAIFWRREIVPQPGQQVVELKNIFFGWRDNIFVAYRRNTSTQGAFELCVDEFLSTGDVLRSTKSPRIVGYRASSFHFLPNDEIRAVVDRATDSAGGGTIVEHAVFDASRGFRILAAYAIVNPGRAYRLDATIDTSGTAVALFTQYSNARDTLEVQILRLPEREAVEWIAVTGIVERVGVIASHSDPRGGAFLTWTVQRDGKNEAWLQKITADAATPWSRMLASPNPAGDSLMAMKYVEVLVNERTGTYIGGLYEQNFVVQRIDSLGRRRWSLAVPWLLRFDTALAGVRSVKMDRSGALYVLTAESSMFSFGTGFMRILRIRGAETSSIADESFSAGTGGSFFAAEPTIAPNPATDAVSLRFSLHRAANVRIELFDVVGEKLATIANVRCESGENVHEFSAQTLGIPSGAYLVKITAGVETRALPIRVIR